MKRIDWKPTIILFTLFILTACGSSDKPADPPTQPGDSSPIVETDAAISLTPTKVKSYEPTEHLIGIREGEMGAEFYHKGTGEVFVPIGTNLIQFHLPVGDTTFTIGDYDREWLDEQLAEMNGLGFNTLRVFLDLCNERCITSPSGGLNKEFLENVADFLGLAKDHDLFVVLTANDLADDSSYSAGIPCCDPFGGYRGSYYLAPGGVAAWENYFSDIVAGLIEAGAPTEQVLAYQINNEQFFLMDIPPLSLDSGEVTTANGQSYDMASREEKRRMVEDGLIYFGDQVREAILAQDPSALVTIGFFPPDEPHVGRGDNRLVLTDRFIQESSLDFFDLHPYDWGTITLREEAENFGILEGYEDKPLLMGEFGAFTYLYDSPQAGAEAVARWQAESCEYGFDGWLYWLWGERDFNNEVWTGSEGDNAINIALSPNTRPDPCDAGEYALPTNLAAGASILTSASLAENPAALMTDGLLSTNWGAGNDAPQWIQFDLGAPKELSEIKLLVSQYPAGYTSHQVRGRSAEGEWVLLTTFSGETEDGDWLVHEFDEPLVGIRYLQVYTSSSPSWVSWYEILVIGE